MTREEAIQYLQQLYPNGGHCWLDEQRMEAIDMAVKALQEEPVSEDERIRKRIIHALHGDVLDMEETTKAIAWLEKQGETSPILSNSSNIGKNKQRPTWSEEDEYCLDGAIETEQYMLDVVNEKRKFDVGNISIKEECTRELIWLKSLKDRIQWKPSDDQMNALLWIIENTPKSVEINILLNSLYEQLKAL